MKLIATIYKELLLLRRDRAGLLVLFLMPAALVLVISLVQENVLKSMTETRTRVLLVDQDQQELGAALARELGGTGLLEIIRQLDGRPLTVDAAEKAVRDGDFQFGLVIPPGFSAGVQARSRQMVAAALETPAAPAAETAVGVPELVVFFDPLVQGSVRSAVTAALNQALMGIEIRAKLAIFGKLLPAQLERVLKEKAGPYALAGLAENLPALDTGWGGQRLTAIRERLSGGPHGSPLPTAVQQNVPAWTLFGMFFICVPLAGGLIRERRDGTLLRLRVMPVSYLTLVSGKVAAYALVCLVQFGFIAALGRWVLPRLGTAVLTMGNAPLAVGAVLLSATLAATAYGVLLGTVARTYEQASMFGAITVVMAAALGGVMVPVFAMPPMMQQISGMSPLGWGLEGFLTIFVRGGTLASVFPNLLRMLAFAVASLLGAWLFSKGRGRETG